MIRAIPLMLAALFISPAVEAAATDWLVALDRYAKADAAVALCAKPPPDMRDSFLTNYQAVIARAKFQLKAQYPTYSDANLAELVRQKAVRSTEATVRLLREQGGCKARMAGALVKDYGTLANGAMFPLR